MNRSRLVAFAASFFLIGKSVSAQCAICTLSVSEVPNCAWGPYRDAAEGCESDGNSYCFVWGACGGSFAKLAAPELRQHWQLLAGPPAQSFAKEIVSSRTLASFLIPVDCTGKSNHSSAWLSPGA
jgi:hypothetical protein